MTEPDSLPGMWRWPAPLVVKHFVERVGIQQVAKEAGTTAATLERFMRGVSNVGKPSQYKIEGWAQRKGTDAYRALHPNPPKLRSYGVDEEPETH